MYFNDLPKRVKYEFYYNEPLFYLIIDVKQQKIREWTDEPLSYLIYKKEDWKRVLLIEKLQEEIIEELKEYVKHNISKYWIDKYDEIKNYKYVCQFDDEIVKNCYKKYFIEKKKDLSKLKENLIRKWKNIEKVIDIDDILRISIGDVLDRLGVEYKKIGVDTLALYDNWRRTDWWRANLEKNIITDFSNKWRPQWNPFVFVKKYLGLNDEETFAFFKKEFNL